MNGMIVRAAEVCSNEVCNQVEVDKGLVAGLVAFIGGFFFLFMLLGMLSLAFWIWMLVDSIKKTEAEFQKIGSGEKNLWVILMILSLFFGFYFILAIVYYFVIYRKTKKAVTVKK